MYSKCKCTSCLSNCKCHVASDYCNLVLLDSPEGRESLAIANRPFTKDLHSDGCLHHNIEGQKNSDLDVRLKLPHTMLHTKHKVKQALTTVISLQLFTSCLNRGE